MKNVLKKCFMLVILMLFFIPLAAFSANVEPVVSTDWLANNISNPKVVIIDIRKAEDYKENHIQNSINIVAKSWITKKKDILNEMISDDDLKDLIGDAGIRQDSVVVIAGTVAAPIDLVSAARVAWTLIYAGVKDVAILNGGVEKWEKKPKAKPFTPKFDKTLLVNKDYVMKNLDKAIIVDVRPADFYSGDKKQTFVERAGHIKNAKNLPWGTLLNEDKTYKSKDEIEKIMAPVIGTDKTKTIIFYCDTGMFATPGWFMAYSLSGYANAKVYDGSAQEWAADPNVPMDK
ncbi:MAG: sulfurtransferase [Proteobacteria bacterium]|nr:sulfurtransferase [Pseudomonadota bacterium]